MQTLEECRRRRARQQAPAVSTCASHAAGNEQFCFDSGLLHATSTGGSLLDPRLFLLRVDVFLSTALGRSHNAKYRANERSMLCLSCGQAMDAPLDVFLFAGQGTVALDSHFVRRRALADAASHSGALLLSACHAAFCAELSSLSPLEADAVDVHISDFATPPDLLLLPSKDQYLHNPVTCGPVLFLVQVLRCLAHLESQPPASAPAASGLVARHFHALGFSSGILPACVLSASTTTLEYLAHSLQVFRLSFWIGVRAQLHRVSVLAAGSPPPSDSKSWTLMVFRTDAGAAAQAIIKYQHTVSTPSPPRVSRCRSSETVTTAAVVMRDRSARRRARRYIWTAGLSRGVCLDFVPQCRRPQNHHRGTLSLF